MSRNQNRRGGRKRERHDGWLADARDAASMANAAFDSYYRGAVVAEAEWGAFAAALRRPLPMALRVHPSTARPDAVLAHVRGRLDAVLPTAPIPFVPGGVALQCAVSRGDLKRSAALAELKRAIAALNEGGCLTRQEAVSMIPAVLLQVRPGSRVLDMCAAPGSKTSQILEALAADRDGGVVVANDVNASRLDVLLHQTSRTAGAHPHLIVTHYDAARFPPLPPEEKFDRVLCDVMCSGDGTLRKSMDLWPRWNTLQGADLHPAQLRVLARGMALCRRGGLVVYSTCSLNPVEDEAVVSECLAQANGAFRLVDPEPLAPGLVATRGLDDWSLLTKDCATRLRTFAEAEALAATNGGRGFRYRPSMFPDAVRLRQQNIHFARRVLPHQQDTGGFFVAVMECVEELPAPAAEAHGASGTAAALQPLSPALQETVRAALRLPADFPTARLFSRGETARGQKFYYANPAAAALAGRLGPRVVHVGCKVFEAYAKHSNEKLRFSPDGAATLAALLPPSFVADVGAEELLALSRAGALPDAAVAAGARLPPERSFLLRCDMPVAGPVYVAAERIVAGQVSAKVFDWQAALAKLTLGQPLAAATSDGATEEETEAPTPAGESATS